MAIYYDYSTGHIYSVMGELKRCVGQYARWYDYIKVGISSQPYARWNQHQNERRRYDDSWEKMVVIYETSSWKSACTVERLLVQHVRSKAYECEIWNGVGGGGGRRPLMKPNCRAYVYLLLDGKTVP